MTTSRKTAPKTAVVEEVDEAVSEEAAQEEQAPVEVVEVSPKTVPFTAPNTWTAYYGGKRYDFIEGKKYNLSPEVAAWFSK